MPDLTPTLPPDVPTADPDVTADPGAEAGGLTPPARQVPVDRYELGDEIARGGMGVVYRATDTAFGREVAVKVLQGRFGPSTAAARRFADEARITAQLQHPGIPPVYDCGTLPDGRPFLAMKLIKGRTLEDLLEAGEADRGRLVAVFEHVCQAVGYAHAHEVIHRDLKPANVMVGAFGEVQVMDWGLASGRHEPAVHDPEATAPGTTIDPLRGAADATQAGSLLGTPAYMAPEQAMGAVDEVDARSDVFGLGAILCHLLTGAPPYGGATAEEARKQAIRGQLDDALVRLAGCGADPDLVALCRRCLSREKGDRPADGGAVAAAGGRLRAAADDRARRAEADRAATEAEAREQRKRRRVQLLLAGAVGLLLAGGGLAGWWVDRQAGERRAERERLEGEATAEALRRQVEDDRRAADDEWRARVEENRRRLNADATVDLLTRCEGCLRRGDPEDADRADVLLKDIELRLVVDRPEALLKRAARCTIDSATLRELDRIDEAAWSSISTIKSDPAFDPDALAARIVADRQAAFGRFGVHAGRTAPAEAARRVTESLVADRLLYALDVWLAESRSAEVREILAAADPDPYRSAVRDATLAADPDRMNALLAEPVALRQPPWFAAVLGLTAGLSDRGREVLQAALARRPGDVTLLMVLGVHGMASEAARFDRKADGDRPAGSDPVRWFQAAVAAHPRNPTAHLLLAAALSVQGDDGGALRHAEQLVRLRPDAVYGQAIVASLRERTGDWDGAAVAYREAVRLAPQSTMYAEALARTAARADRTAPPPRPAKP